MACLQYLAVHAHIRRILRHPITHVKIPVTYLSKKIVLPRLSFESHVHYWRRLALPA